MNNFKELASFGIFAALAGFSFGAVFFGIAFVYASINHQQEISMAAVAAIIFGIVGLVVGITQSNKKRQSISV
ncbi:hypothetical protein [Vibrio alfacsensis]|uniref:hypothetical protein n=1 Tax=Vibrio alfacsensis TaxID=1074311 RepID=UPI00406873B1